MVQLHALYLTGPRCHRFFQSKKWPPMTAAQAATLMGTLQQRLADAGKAERVLFSLLPV